MGASSSGLLDEAKITHVKGLVDSSFQSFSVFYRQQHAAAYFRHLHQEVEPKKEGRGLLLTPGPQYAPEDVLYQGCVKFSCWDEQGKKNKERHVVIRRDYKVEIHDNMETFSRGTAAKLVLHTAGGSVFTTEQESRAHLELTCAAVLNDAKEDSSSVVSSPDVFAVYLHLPYMGHTCFLFQQEEERDHFLSALKTCIRHCNLDPWCDPSYESQAYVQALRFYRQDKGSYESWEKLLGTEEKVLASQVMEEVLPWLQSQLQARVKGKKTERIRLWLATMQATYTLVLQQLTASLEALREECRQTAAANQALIRSNLDQIMSSHCFLEEKLKGCVCGEAEKVCSECVAPYMSSILEVLTQNISAGIQGMRRTLQAQMDTTFNHTNGGAPETKTALSTLRSISLDQSYRQVEKLTEKLEGLKQRFGWSSTQRLVHSAHLQMEKLLDSAVYTLELFLQSSARLQPSQVPVKMERAKERVLKQLDYDSRVVQKRLYQEALLEITLPTLTRRMDSKWRPELQQFEQYIFSDYSSFVLVHNIYDGVLRNLLSQEIETALQDAASKKSNNLLLDTSDLAISQYSLLGQTPPRSAPDSPAIHARGSSSAAPSEEPAAVVEEEAAAQTVTAYVCPQSDPELNDDAKSDPSTTPSSEQSTALLSPVIVVTQQPDEPSSAEEAQGEEPLGSVAPSATDDFTSSDAGQEAAPDPPADPESTTPIPVSPPMSSPQSTDDPPEGSPSDDTAIPEKSATPDLSTADQVTEDLTSDQPPCPSSSPPPCADSPVKISLGSLSEAIGCNAEDPSVMQMMAQKNTDRAVYLTGEMKDNWEVERAKEEKLKEAAEEEERTKEGKHETETETGEQEEEETEEKKEMEEKEKARTEEEMERGEAVDEGCQHSEPPAETATEQRESEERVDEGGEGGQLDTKEGKEDEAGAEGRGAEEAKTEEEEVLQSPQPVESQPLESQPVESQPVESQPVESQPVESQPVEPQPVESQPVESQPVESQPDSAAELPLDSVSIIRELVTEITEVEIAVSPCPNGTHTP